MGCFYPNIGYRARSGKNDNGTWPIVFNRSQGYIDTAMELPCGRCLECLIERSRQWAVRSVHELQFHTRSSFITLTYNDDHVTDGLQKTEIVGFMKRLRERLDRESGTKIRYLYCGEYGAKTMRPHFHALIFGYDFPDKKYLKITPSKSLIYKSEELLDIWQNRGHVSIGEVNFQTAAYVARYVTKKKFGQNAEDHYLGRPREFAQASRNKGLGHAFIEKYWQNVYDHDGFHVNGHFMKPPRYYDKYLEQVDPEKYRQIKFIRREKAKEFKISDESSWERLTVKQKLKELRYAKLKRELDIDNSQSGD